MIMQYKNKELGFFEGKPIHLGNINGIAVYYGEEMKEDFILGKEFDGFKEKIKFALGKYKKLEDYEDFLYKNVINKRIKLSKGELSR